MRKKIFTIFMILILLMPVVAFAKGNKEENTADKDPYSGAFDGEEYNVIPDGTTQEYDCKGLLGPKGYDFVQKMLGWIRVLGPLTLLVFMAADMITIVVSGDEKSQAAALSKVGGRIIATVLLFLVPSLVSIILSIPTIKEAVGGNALCGVDGSSGGSGGGSSGGSGGSGNTRVTITGNNYGKDSLAPIFKNWYSNANNCGVSGSCEYNILGNNGNADCWYFYIPSSKTLQVNCGNQIKTIFEEKNVNIDDFDSKIWPKLVNYYK